MPLATQNGVWLVEDAGSRWLTPGETGSDLIGSKGVGLCSLPAAWTQPFFAIAPGVVASIMAGHRPTAVQSALQSAGASLGFRQDTPILVRSSAHCEGLEERGSLHSVPGEFSAIFDSVVRCCELLSADEEGRGLHIALIVQKRVMPQRLKGHLSNERRFVEEARDWVWEAETPQSPGYRRIAIRPWRELKNVEHGALVCVRELSLETVLRVPAQWAHHRGARVHFEWVWDGSSVFVVQADEVPKLRGINPFDAAKKNAAPVSDFEPKVLQRMGAVEQSPYEKLRNVLTYRRMGLPTTTFYLLDGAEKLSRVLSDLPYKDLNEDLSQLCKRPLVIRSDLANVRQADRQLLPRSSEISSSEAAMIFLRAALKELIDRGFELDRIGFLVHNFIPAAASAWSYAEPRGRKVLVESLWGIPEGLYYFGHDKYTIDTRRVDASSLTQEDESGFVVTRKLAFKRYCVAPSESGSWDPVEVGEPFDWRPSLRKAKWPGYIARLSRALAHECSYPVNIMWFVDVERSTGLPEVIAWFHEKSELKEFRPVRSRRKKSLLDREEIIESEEDIVHLEDLAAAGSAAIRYISIRPRREALLRDKAIAKRIGEVAKRLGAVIELEGGQLSHVYYILARTGAQVQVADVTASDVEFQEFNKLVRDRIPRRVAAVGESVRVGRLRDEQFVEALRVKLVEEALEARDASSDEELIEELADVLEVIESLRTRIGVGRAQLEARRKRKRDERGGFDGGVVLLETVNPPALVDSMASSQPLVDELMAPNDVHDIGETLLPPEIVQKSTDRRKHGDVDEEMLVARAPVSMRSWSAEGGEFRGSDGKGNVVRYRPRVSVRREKGELRVEVSLTSDAIQLRLEI